MMKSPPDWLYKLYVPSPPTPTMNAFGATVPGAKLRLLANGNGAPLGYNVAKPSGAPIVLSTVELPTNADAAVGTLMPLNVNRVCSRRDENDRCRSRGNSRLERETDKDKYHCREGPETCRNDATHR